jgi:hypothetical protein
MAISKLGMKVPMLQYKFVNLELAQKVTKKTDIA